MPISPTPRTADTMGLACDLYNLNTVGIPQIVITLFRVLEPPPPGLSVPYLHYIRKKVDISTADIPKTQHLTLKPSRWINNTTSKTKNMYF